MKIEKILNNNVLVTTDCNGRELIVMGRGIGFKKSMGDAIDESCIDKRFYPRDDEASNSMRRIVADIPEEYLDVAEKIVSIAQTRLSVSIDDSVLVSLADHLHIAIPRFMEGVVLGNALLWDVKNYYPQEYAIAQTALDIVEQRFGVRLPDDEAGFIALHIVGAQAADAQNVQSMTRMVGEICNIVRYSLGMHIDTDSTSWYRFLTHLKFFVRRIMERSSAPQRGIENLYDAVSAQYPKAAVCVDRIADFIAGKYSYVASKEEKTYLCMHIGRVISSIPTIGCQNPDGGSEERGCME